MQATFPWKGPSKEVILLYQIKAGPINGRQVIHEQGRSIRKNGQPGGIGLGEGPQLLVH